MKTLFSFFTLLILISPCVSNLMAKHDSERKTPFSNHGESHQNQPYVHFRSRRHRNYFIPEECTMLCPERCLRKHRLMVFCSIPQHICRCSSFQIRSPHIATSPKQSLNK
ncbi:hypothetical protein ARALYDRAFT_332331 [Arabidopsis lyrata subsp. lyrata]|uniref:Uncharacterized protein n=1 Tax=Arabidopsis lyrata subsp. lyrata TaxID=81972 RepID=D7MUE2_ARALL|nr:putative defensin-like protein 224 [Arabidopsis lyrata subsp. lyrata]EFH42655.1 hypothetical protein ARALYDRAFT_332331 [Arabidopsis lyrata subsp. lyrata]|eukprot:XP_002866396.1 putative defensin-like protein 224 [Arabidopsis lyrata subsp. lyrata]